MTFRKLCKTGWLTRTARRQNLRHCSAQCGGFLGCCAKNGSSFYTFELKPIAAQIDPIGQLIFQFAAM